MNKEQNRAILRLFKGYVIDDEQFMTDAEQKQILNQCVSNGVMLDDITHYVANSILVDGIAMYGVKPKEWNLTFHKSFETVLNTPIEELVTQQLIHYFTTYGLKELGLFNENLVYIPNEKLEIPEFEGKITLAILHAYTHKDLQLKIMNLLTSGVALSEQDVQDIITLSDYLDKSRVEEINNKEIKTVLYEKYDLVPQNAVEFIRYLVYKTTGMTLLIKNNDTIYKIKDCNKNLAYDMFRRYLDTPEKYISLAEVYNRYKKIILAYKMHRNERYHKSERTRMNKIINRISKLAKTYHKPVGVKILDTLTQIKTTTEYESKKTKILSELDSVTIFKEITILNGLRYRYYVSNHNEYDSIVYRVRNGKVFATKNENILEDESKYVCGILVELVEQHLVDRLRPKVENKTFYFPQNVRYTLPTSLKKFVGNIPDGTELVIPRYKNVVIGVHWKNLGNESVDLDLKILNEHEDIGWNSSYYSSDTSVVFTGDITNAPLPNGATEAMLIQEKTKNNSYIIKLNNYTANRAEVPFEMFVAGSDSRINVSDIKANYVVNSNDVLISIQNSFKNDINSQSLNLSLTLGQVTIDEDNVYITFVNNSDESKIVSSMNDVVKDIYNYNKAYRDSQLRLQSIIDMSGGIIVDSKSIIQKVPVEDTTSDDITYKDVEVPVDYDFSLDNIQKEMLIDLLA